MDSGENNNLTGRYLVTFREDAKREGLDLLHDLLGQGVRLAASSDFAGGVDVERLGDAAGLTFDRLNIAVVDAPPDATTRLASEAGDDSPIESVEPERIMYAEAPVLTNGQTVTEYELIEMPATTVEQPPELRTLSPEYLRGLRDGMESVFSRLIVERPSTVEREAQLEAAQVFNDTSRATWGLQATRAIQSRYTGKGIRVAVLDTGISRRHPDFRLNAANLRSFIPGEDVEDEHGHGTHCAGTVCGPVSPSGGRRYGCAPRAELFVGKVLSNAGSGSDSGILAGIDWALGNRCAVISMSLSGPGPVSPTYEAVGRRALRQNCLIVAAASNTANRQAGELGRVQRPANCDSILAVAAIDRRLGIANFSPRGAVSGGDKIDIAAPGVDVYSAWRVGQRLYHTISGTSMATPHVAGIAALWAEATTARGEALWRLLLSRARRLSLLSQDIGAGLVQTP